MYATRFLGRERGLQQLLALSQARRGGPAWLVLLGATAGMGKSRLIAEHRRSAEAGRIFAVGACLAYAGAILAPFAQIVRSFAERSPETVRNHPRIFERLGAFDDEYESGLQTPPREEKLRLFELYSSAMRAFSRETPITLLLEDVHWADSNSLELIQYLAQAPGAANLVVIATFRSDELNREHPLRGLVGRLSPLPNVERIELPRLDDASIDVLVQSILAGTSVDTSERNAIRARSEGNPLFAEELARHVRGRHGNREHERLPLSIEETVCARLPQLSPDERSILLRVAVLGRTFDARMLADVAGAQLAHVLEVLRRARDLAFITEGPAGFSFRHALTHEALYGELLEAERRTIHAQTLAIFESQPEWSVRTLMTVAAHGSSEDLATARNVLAASFSALASAVLSLFDAIASLRAHREDESLALARAAATGLRSFGFRYFEALAWELACEKQLALDLFIEMASHNDVRRVQRSMLTVNRRGRAENELTSRELEIAKAIAAGHQSDDRRTLLLARDRPVIPLWWPRAVLEPGKIADAIMVDGNPLNDISQLRRGETTIKGGTCTIRTRSTRQLA